MERLVFSDLLTKTTVLDVVCSLVMPVMRIVAAHITMRTPTSVVWSRSVLGNLRFIAGGDFAFFLPGVTVSGNRGFGIA